MRYRRLTSEELLALEGDFVQYLAEQGVTALDWQRWTLPSAERNAQWERVDACLDGFSEAFWEKACSRITHLTRPAEQEVWWFEFGESQAFALAVPRASQSQEDNGRALESGSIQGFEARRSFAREARNTLIFELLEQGAQPCSAEAFEAVKSQCLGPTQGAPFSSQAETH